MKKMKTFLSLAVAFAMLSAVASADVIVSSDDFDGNAAGEALGVNANIGATIVVDPLDATNMVSAIELEPGGEWGSYLDRNNPGISMAALGLSAGDVLTYSWDMMVPAGTTAGAGDTTSLIIRWGDGSGAVPNPGNSSGGLTTFNALAADTWVNVSGTITIPATNPVDGLTVTNFNPIWSFRDDPAPNPIGAAPADPGVSVYVDNWSLSRIDPVPEPGSLAVLGLLGGLVSLRRRR